MADALLVGALTQVVACASFGYVVWLLLRQHPPESERTAHEAFVVFWAAMSLYMAKSAGFALFALAGWTPLAPFVASRYLEILLVCLAGWGLTYYVLFLFTGRPWLRLVVAGYFTVVGLVYATAVALARPTQVVRNQWQVSLAPATPALDAIYVCFGVPLFLSILAYLSLVRHPILPIQRYRIAMVSTSLLAWVGGGLAVSLGGDPLWIFLGITGLGIVTSVAVVLGFNPPASVRRWLGAPVQRTPHPRHVDEGLQQRVRQLI